VKYKERYRSGDLTSNTHVHILALALVLARIIFLDHCLNIAKQQGSTFTCKHWLLLQVGFYDMRVMDLFKFLFMRIKDVIHRRTVSMETMAALVQTRFEDLHRRLSSPPYNTSAQQFGYKVLLVIDEAQNLGKDEFGLFPSQQIRTE